VSLQDLVKLSLTKKLVVFRHLPEIGVEDQPLPCLEIYVRGNKLAWATPSGRAAPYVVRSAFVVSAQNYGARIVVESAQGFPVTSFVFREAIEGEVTVWDAAQEELDDLDDQMEAEVKMEVEKLSKPSSPALTPFAFVSWSAVVDGNLLPAGVMLANPDRSGILASPFRGFEDEADFWSQRFDQVSETILDELSEYAGRDQDIGTPESVKASSFEDAIDRAKYRVAAQHYAETGKSLYA